MKNRILFICLLFVFLGPFCAASPAGELVVASFEKNGRSDLGTEISTWNSNPLDTSQGCTIEMIKIYGVYGKPTEESRVMKVSYDVATNGPAFNGVYIKLNGLDLTPYKKISLLIKGDEKAGFTTKFKIDLKNTRGERVSHEITGITSDWQELSIPMQELEDLGMISDWTCMSDIVFTFDDMTCDKKEGVLYIDNVEFSSDK